MTSEMVKLVLADTFVWVPFALGAEVIVGGAYLAICIDGEMKVRVHEAKDWPRSLEFP
jgi:hypothetical protein